MRMCFWRVVYGPHSVHPIPIPRGLPLHLTSTLQSSKGLAGELVLWLQQVGGSVDSALPCSRDTLGGHERSSAQTMGRQEILLRGIALLFRSFPGIKKRDGFPWTRCGSIGELVGAV